MQHGHDSWRLINQMLPFNLRKLRPFSIKLDAITIYLMSLLSYSVTAQDPIEKVRSFQNNPRRRRLAWQPSAGQWATS
jgi:hypothetical protein